MERDDSDRLGETRTDSEKAQTWASHYLRDSDTVGVRSALDPSRRLRSESPA